MSCFRCPAWPSLAATLYFLVVVSSAASLQADMVFGNYQPPRHDRFNDAASFLGAAFDWTGVGHSGGTWATMISPTKFLSANHSHPDVGSSVSFWESNSPLAVPVTRTVAGGQRVGTTDLWVGVLSTPVPATIQVYPIATAGIADIDAGLGVYENAMVYTVGKRGLNNFAVGTNVYDVGDGSPSILGTFDSIGFIEDLAGATNFQGDDETLLQKGDSGAPSFIAESGVLTLVGIHAFIAENVTSDNFHDEFSYRTDESTLFAGSVRNISFDNFVPNYSAQIQAIPEPNAAWLFGVCMMMLLALKIATCLRVTNAVRD